MPTAALSAVYQQEARTQFLEALYFQDKRDNPQHPLHGRYTGLFQKACEKLGRNQWYENIATLCKDAKDSEYLFHELEQMRIRAHG